MAKTIAIFLLNQLSDWCENKAHEKIKWTTYKLLFHEQWIKLNFIFFTIKEAVYIISIGYILNIFAVWTIKAEPIQVTLADDTTNMSIFAVGTCW